MKQLSTTHDERFGKRPAAGDATAGRTPPGSTGSVPGGFPVRLRDGAVVWLRPIHRDDEALLIEHFEHLDSEARYRRFLAPVKRLTPGQVHDFTHLDHHAQEGLFALDEAGHPIGVARYISLPDQPGTAEVAAAVVSSWQGRGLGGTLLTQLAYRARQEHITRFIAVMFVSNVPMRRLLQRLGPVKVIERDRSSVTVAAELRP